MSRQVTNKLYSIDKELVLNPMVSKVKVNREYLLTDAVAAELNTYINFEPFRVYNDAYDPTDENPVVGTPGVRSLFNAAGAVVLGSSDGKFPSQKDIISKAAHEFRISNNVPLMDNRESRLAIRRSSDCSIKALVEASSNGELGKSTYAFSDFMYCKHLGKISNNYLITLRRFPLPVDDYISTTGTTHSTRTNESITSQNSTSIGCLVTWMGTPGNEMSNLLKYSYAMPFKTQKAELQDDTSSADAAHGGKIHGILAAFDPVYQKQYQEGKVGKAFNEAAGKFFKVGNVLGDPPYTDMLTRKDQAKVYGPVDVIKDTYVRAEEGLQFDQKFTITFDYELRSYNGINGRQAMLDLLSNILNVTYTTGTFWGGGYRGVGAHQNNIFANMKIFKTSGGASAFLDSFSEDVTTATKGFRDYMQKQHGGSWWTMIKSTLNQLGGMATAGLLNKMGRPNKVALNSLLSPAPVGFWHLTIGNPHHPIMSVGNLVLKGTQIEHYGPLGLDDFPTGIKVTCELERGKPRDIRDIEKLYMHGNDRIYTSMGPKVFDMYRNAKEYKKEKGKLPTAVVGNADSTIVVGGGIENVEIPDISKMKYVLQKYFGNADTYSIYVTACEQEMGAHKKKKKGAGGGDSSVQGNQ